MDAKELAHQLRVVSHKDPICRGWYLWAADWVEQEAKETANLRAAVKAHHDQKADDRCVEDDDKLHAAAGLPPCDRRVGSKEEMLANCARFIERRCEGGGWPSYRELENEIERLRNIITAIHEVAAHARANPECNHSAMLFVELTSRPVSEAMKGWENTSTPPDSTVK